MSELRVALLSEGLSRHEVERVMRALSKRLGGERVYIPQCTMSDAELAPKVRVLVARGMSIRRIAKKLRVDRRHVTRLANEVSPKNAPLNPIQYELVDMECVA